MMGRNASWIGVIGWLWLTAVAPLGAEEAPVIHLTTTERAPFHSPELSGQGYVTELTAAALARVGYRLQVTYLPWTRALKTAALGGSDGVMGLLYNASRSDDLAYSAPLVPVRLALLKRRDFPFRVRYLRDLEAYRVAFLRGGATSIDFGPGVRFEQSVSHDHALQQLLAGRVELMMDLEAVIGYLLASKYAAYRDRIEFAELTLEGGPLYVGFSRARDGYAQHLEAFNRGLEMIRNDGTYDRILRRHGLTPGMVSDDPASTAAPTLAPPVKGQP